MFARRNEHFMMRHVLLAVATFAAVNTADPTTPLAYQTETCITSRCVDYINTCNQAYGGCYPACSGYTTPTFADPGCPVTTVNSLVTTASCSSTVCVDYVNDCELRYGGCFPACGDYTTPSITPPACPTTTYNPTDTTTTTAHRRKHGVVMPASVALQQACHGKVEFCFEGHQ